VEVVVVVEFRSPRASSFPPDNNMHEKEEIVRKKERKKERKKKRDKEKKKCVKGSVKRQVSSSVLQR